MLVIIDTSFLDMYLILAYITFICYSSNVQLYSEILLSANSQKKKSYSFPILLIAQHAPPFRWLDFIVSLISQYFVLIRMGEMFFI